MRVNKNTGHVQCRTRRAMRIGAAKVVVDGSKGWCFAQEVPIGMLDGAAPAGSLALSGQEIT